MAPSMFALSVAIYNNPGIKHWSLFLETENDADRTIIHIVGPRQRYFPQIITPATAPGSNLDFIELHSMCETDETTVETIKSIAWDTPTRNDESDYSCQDFVLDVLVRLEHASVIDATKNGYMSNKATLKAKRESWE
ncbi:uncharacterized protein BDV17DRAFT_291394 [Aspergillus undulatus]|uniref:uncharacterized protein n=1 Tax=Aspergillus undulatus TaxID=1810928 RepID=UPI003CCCB8CD